MKLFLATVASFLLGGLCFSQVSYRIEYQKPLDKTVYKKIEYSATGEKKEIDLNGKLPKLSKGDNVVVAVTNYNPFLYYVLITQDELKASTGKKSNALGFLSMLTGGLSPISGFMSDLVDVQSAMESASKNTRGASSLAKNEDELNLYLAEIQTVSSLIKEYQKKYLQFNNALAKIEKEDLQSEVKSVIEELKGIYKNYYDPSDKIAALSSSSKLHYFKAGIADPAIIENASSFEYHLTKFKEQLTEASNSYTKKGIQDWINTLESAKFSAQKSYVVASDFQTFSMDNVTEDEGQNITVGLDYTIRFYRLKDLRDGITTNNNEPSAQYVKYYYSDKFWNADGVIVDSLCENCVTVLKAEGMYLGDAPRNIESLFENDNPKKLKDEALGKWTFYSEKGELSHILVGPETESRQGNNNVGKVEFDASDLENRYSLLKSIKIPMKGAIVMNWSTGFYTVGSFRPRSTYFPTYNAAGDSLTVQEGKLARSKICIGSQMVFNFQNTQGWLIPSLNLGAAVDFWDEGDVHFLVGGGLKVRKFPFISLSSGLALTRSNVLNETLQVGQTYPQTNEMLSIKKYVPGFYIGLNLNF